MKISTTLDKSSIRGSLVNLPSLLHSLGMVIVWGLGFFLSWRITAYTVISMTSRVENNFAQLKQYSLLLINML